ncbi:piwi-like protein 2 [Lingula anatina]|uniref:Piwi-like protein 2 n=1 Tax=Lingula anatina TaxID=7574 RepID=A0A1S3HC55_LINAN|nr:piwi-like protein 2 [Lingula anatina]|eukprot:XP_013382739.1 piwi-like protein 2 [Lingula anatina]
MRIMSILGMVQVSRHYYDPRHPAMVPQHKLEVWPGYITAIHEREGGLLLLADVSHRVLRTETVLDVMNTILHQKQSGFQDECTRQLVGCTVITRYNNKTYRIDDIAWEKNPEDKFSTSKGEDISFMNYYKSSYNITVADTKQPLLLSRPKKRDQRDGGSDIIALIPELCFMSGLTDEIRSDFRVMKDLAVHTRVSPEQRQLSMKKFINTVNSNADARNELEKWGLSLEPSTVPIQGRLLPEEDIYFRNSNHKAGREADWGRHISRENCILGVDLYNWMVLFTNRDKNRAMDFVRMVQKEGPNMGINIQNPTTLELRNDRTEAYLATIRSNLNPEVQLVVTIFPTSRDDRYNAVKKLCLVDAPVATQVINARTISDQRKLRSVCQKVILQMNAKLGGELWAVKIPVRNTMICGIDVYHEGKGGKAQSVGAFCASMNKDCTRWFSDVYKQTPGEELISGLKMSLSKAIIKYHELNHSLPDRIVIFRDGVGDGQLGMVADYEVSQLESCFSQFGETYQPRLAVIVVQKRINTRIYAKLQGAGRGCQYDNPPPGTVVDHTITRKEWYDFFLVSQHVRQGTVSPTHYIVVHDGSGLNPDQIQRMTYKMTHLYYNWPGTVRVPAPCQYAHKLAYLVGQNLRDKKPHDKLMDKLFFL